MAALRKTVDDLHPWLVDKGGIAHRSEVVAAGFAVTLIRAFVRSGRATVIRRGWIALPSAPDDLREAAFAGGRISCTSLARRRGWWVPPSTSTALHVHMLPGSAFGASERDPGVVTHWTRPLTSVGRGLLATVEDALLHVATCLERDGALVIWESAARVESFAPEALRAIAWPSIAARELADAVSGLSDSGLETLIVAPLRRWGLRVRQQAKIAGRLVDVLIGDRLVLQIDGWEFHASSAQRTKDIAHDAELRLRGYTVLRFSYAQVVHDWPTVERTIRRAVAARLHLAA